MGGGGSGGATPTTPSGYTGGSVMDYTAPAYSASPIQGGGSNFDWGVLGKGFQNTGAGLASSQSPIPQFGSPDLPFGSQTGAPFQPTTIQYDPHLNDALDRIMRLFGGGY